MPESVEITRAAERGLMRSTDVAAFLGVSRQRVDQLVAMGGFPAPRPVAGHLMWDRVEVETWASQHWWDSKPWRAKGHASRGSPLTPS